MAACASCGTTILFGGERRGGDRFCNGICLARAGLLAAGRLVPDADAQLLALRIHAGPCPHCAGEGPIDVHTSHRVWSAVVMTNWQSIPRISCRRCAVKAQGFAIAFSAVLGWWGFPYGFVLTPVQVGRNLVAIATPPDPTRPSAKLVDAARMQLGAIGGGAASSTATPAPSLRSANPAFGRQDADS